MTVGDVIRCSSNTVYPPVSYSWEQYVNESWHQLQQQDGVVGDNDGSGSMLILSTVGVYVLRCSAYNIINGFRYTATLHNVELRVVEPAGKYQMLCIMCTQLSAVDEVMRSCH